MKIKTILKAAAVMLLLPAALHAQDVSGYTISGEIRGLDEGEKIKMTIFDVKKFSFVDADSTTVKNGKFELKGKVPGGARYYMMNFYNHLPKGTRLVINAGENIKITGLTNITEIPHSIIDDYLQVSGSKANQGHLDLVEKTEHYRNRIGMISIQVQKIADSVGFNPVLIGSVLSAREKYHTDFLTETFSKPVHPIPASIIPFEVFIRGFVELSGRSASNVDLYQKLSPDIQKSYWGLALKNKLALSTGQAMPDFNLPDTSEKLISLKSVFQMGKVTVVHFWANKSVMREDLDAKLLTLYKKYHPLGLNIIGVSADSYREEWKEALDQQKYPWTNVIDLKGKLTTEVYQEGGHSVPNTTDVLLDSEGKILAWDPSAVELQYYLWKYLEKK